jgi:hypothetical protein
MYLFQQKIQNEFQIKNIVNDNNQIKYLKKEVKAEMKNLFYDSDFFSERRKLFPSNKFI